MKIFLCITLTILSVFGTTASIPLDQQADSAYAADDFARAAALYQEVMKSEGTSSALYYNLGNCYYRLGKPGLAIVNYERALRLDPSDASAKANLEFVNSKIFDRQGDRGSFMSNAFDNAATFTSSNAMAWTAFALFALCLCAVGLYIFASSIGLRKVGFFGAIVLLIGCIVTAVLAIRGAHIATNRNFAIITSPSALLSTSPREPKDRREEAMLLHEGTKVEILDSISAQNDSTGLKWLDVQVDNNHRAWIKSSDVERI